MQAVKIDAKYGTSITSNHHRREAASLNNSDRSADVVTLALQGAEVARCCVDYAVSLETGEGHRAVLRIEGEFRFGRGDESLRLSAERPMELGPIVALRGATILAAQADSRGSLILRFSGDAWLTVDPDPDYEAWELTGPAGERIVALPGGGLATWSGFGGMA